MRNHDVVVLKKFRIVLGIFIFGLIVSGVTAFPLQLELEKIAAFRGVDSLSAANAGSGFDQWIIIVRDGLRESYAKFPWLAYGTDWLAFAHIIIALFFIGAFKHPVQNTWILKAGMIACALVVPFALICGGVRQIPFEWRLIDCSFGVIGIVPLWYCLRLTKVMKRCSENAERE